MAAVLLLAAIVSHVFPVHIRHNTKINVSSVPLYLMVILLSPALAAAAVGLSVLADGLMFRVQRGNYLSDIATEVGRWIVVTFCGSAVAHLPALQGSLSALHLLVGGAVLWVGDILSSPLVLAPISGESPRSIVLTMAREAGPAEAAQYLVGLMGAVVAAHQIWAIALLLVPTAIVHITAKNAKELHERTRQVLETMADWVDVRDPYTGGHSRRVAELSADIMRELRMRGPEVDLIVQAARLHDIGKISLPDRVLNKNDMLSEAEEALVRMHPVQGAELLRRHKTFERGREMVQHHHERWDGTGYPHGLKGTEIPLGARIIAVADSFDAMTTDRPYRRALSVDHAASLLRQGRGRQWDPSVVDALLRCVAAETNEKVAVVRNVTTMLMPVASA